MHKGTGAACFFQAFWVIGLHEDKFRAPMRSVFVLVEEKVVVSRIVRPNVFDALVEFAVVFQFAEVVYDFRGRSGSDSVVYQFVFRGGPWCFLQVRGQFERLVHR